MSVRRGMGQRSPRGGLCCCQWYQCSLLGRAQDLGSPCHLRPPVCEPQQHPRKGPLSLEPCLLPESGGHNKEDVSGRQPGMGSCVRNK